MVGQYDTSVLRETAECFLATKQLLIYPVYPLDLPIIVMIYYSREGLGGARMEIKRIDKELPLPRYMTKGSVGLDCYVREDTVVQPHAAVWVPLNIVVEAPEGTMIAVLPRCSTFRKTGLILANSIGVIDQDYCGEEDEIMAQVWNTTDNPVTLERGGRYFQLIIIRIETPEIIEVDKMEEKSRGGFGSTDNFKEG